VGQWHDMYTEDTTTLVLRAGRPSGKKATARIPPEWPSGVYSDSSCGVPEPDCAVTSTFPKNVGLHGCDTCNRVQVIYLHDRCSSSHGEYA
jgi:hypothetical protein